MGIETPAALLERINQVLADKNYPPYPTEARSRSRLEQAQSEHVIKIMDEVLKPELGEPGGWRKAPSGAPFTCNYWPMDGGIYIYFGVDNRLHIWSKT